MVLIGFFRRNFLLEFIPQTFKLLFLWVCLNHSKFITIPQVVSKVDIWWRYQVNCHEIGGHNILWSQFRFMLVRSTESGLEKRMNRIMIHAPLRYPWSNAKGVTLEALDVMFFLGSDSVTSRP